MNILVCDNSSVYMIFHYSDIVDIQYASTSVHSVHHNQM